LNDLQLINRLLLRQLKTPRRFENLVCELLDCRRSTRAVTREATLRHHVADAD
jgi:hypothetical protein